MQECPSKKVDEKILFLQTNLQSCKTEVREEKQKILESKYLQNSKHVIQICQRAEGNKDVSEIIKDITLTSTRATKLRKVIHSVNEALAILVVKYFTRRQLVMLHNVNKSIYP